VWRTVVGGQAKSGLVARIPLLGGVVAGKRIAEGNYGKLNLTKQIF
jgi:hypothetical protein